MTTRMLEFKMGVMMEVTNNTIKVVLQVQVEMTNNQVGVVLQVQVEMSVQIPEMQLCGVQTLS